MKPAAIDFTEKVNKVILKFCSENCKVDFHHNPTVVNMLPVTFTVGIINKEAVLSLPSGHAMLQDVKDYYDECGEELAAQQTLRLCIGDGSTQYPKDKIYIIYEYSTVLCKNVAAFFINNDLTLSMIPLPYQNCDAEVVESFRESIQTRITPMLEAVANKDGFSNFSAWCSAVLVNINTKAAMSCDVSTLQHLSDPLLSPNNVACSYCNHRSNNLKRCSRCRSVQYCGQECQKRHWNTHKSQCQPFRLSK